MKTIKRPCNEAEKMPHTPVSEPWRRFLPTENSLAVSYCCNNGWHWAAVWHSPDTSLDYLRVEKRPGGPTTVDLDSVRSASVETLPYLVRALQAIVQIVEAFEREDFAPTIEGLRVEDPEAGGFWNPWRPWKDKEAE